MAYGFNDDKSTQDVVSKRALTSAVDNLNADIMMTDWEVDLPIGSTGDGGDSVYVRMSNFTAIGIAGVELSSKDAYVYSIGFNQNYTDKFSYINIRVASRNGSALAGLKATIYVMYISNNLLNK